MPAIDKPWPYILLDKTQAEEENALCESPLVLIDCKKNLGFAGGNNVGLRYSMQQPDMSWAWLLNNDTVVDSSALIELQKYCRVYKPKALPLLWFCGL